jgi:RNA polymerase sigma-70 factor, ECF subfamily
MTDFVDSEAAAEANYPMSRLFERHHGEIFGYLNRMVSDRELAQDLTQETFLQAHRAGRQLPEVLNPRAWLYRIATNLALNAIRRRSRFAWLPWISTDHRSLDFAGQVGERNAVEVALAALQPAYRAPLLLYCHYGFSMAEVAQALAISEGAARTRVYRAREMFRAAYERENA